MTPEQIAYAEKAEGFATRPSTMEKLNRLLRELDLPKGSEVLDIGCSTGIALEVMQRRGLIAYGIDVNPAAIEIAQDRGFRATLAVEKKFNIPDYGTDRYDAATITYVMNHVKMPFCTLVAAFEALHPGGQIGIINPNPWHHWAMTPRNWKNGYKSDATQRQSISRKRMEFDLKLAGFVDVRGAGIGLASFGFIKPHYWLIARKPWK